MSRTGTGITRRGWLKAGQDILREKGIEGVSLKALTMHLGVTKGSFYHHFSDFGTYITDLANHFSGEHLDQIFAEAEKRAAGDPVKQIQEIAAIILKDDEYPLMDAMRAWAKHNEVAAASIQRLDQQSHTHLVKIFRNMGFSPSEAKVRAFVVHSSAISGLDPTKLGLNRETVLKQALSLFL